MQDLPTMTTTAGNSTNVTYGHEGEKEQRGGKLGGGDCGLLICIHIIFVNSQNFIFGKCKKS